MKISILCSDSNHPVNSYISDWLLKNRELHDIKLIRDRLDLPGGDILFLISCSEIIRSKDRAKYKKSLVLHAGDLPKGRGWSPHIWEIINGNDFIVLTLLEAEDKVDSGKIWKKEKIDIPSDALWDEINKYLFNAEIRMIDFAIKNIDNVIAHDQDDSSSTYYRKRSPKDSQLDIDKSIFAQFDKIRVCDPGRFPAYIEHRGFKYKVTLEKMEKLDNGN